MTDAIMAKPSAPIPFQFTEDMRGFVHLGATAFQDGYDRGKAAGTALMFHLTLKTEDLSRFISEKAHEAKAIGYVECAALGGRCPVELGWFNLFEATADPNRREMTYRLFFRAANDQRKLTLTGHKEAQGRPGGEVWHDTTTLYTNLYEGYVEAKDEPGATLVAAGILHISIEDFLKELGTVRSFAPTHAERAAAVERFGKFFLASLWDSYAYLPSLKLKPYEREIPLYTTEGVTNAEVTSYPFATGDKIGLSLMRFKRAPSRDVVMLIHGLTTSTDMFIMPEHYNIVQYLLDNGFTDVWSLDFRMSNRFSYNLHRSRYNMDDIALFDYPAAIAELRKHVEPGTRIHVICHCLGSVTFTMSLFGQAVTGVRSVIANSVSLTPRVPGWSGIKLALAPVLCEYVAGIDYANPYWRRSPGLSIGKFLGTLVSAMHHECDVPECHMLSFMWGTGFPALYSHENLHDITHRRGGDLYGGTSFHYFRHVRKMVKSNNTAVKYDPADPKYRPLPDNYLERAKQIETPVLFMTGQNNHVFTDSNILCHQRLEQIAPGRHQLHVFPNYGHQDVFMGKNCHIDIFPPLLKFLNEQRT